MPTTPLGLMNPAPSPGLIETHTCIGGTWYGGGSSESQVRPSRMSLPSQVPACVEA
jgi:hypothetical protein